MQIKVISVYKHKKVFLSSLFKAYFNSFSRKIRSFFPVRPTAHLLGLPPFEATNHASKALKMAVDP